MTYLLTEEQISEYKDTFDLIDRDGDDAISMKELGIMMRSLGHDLPDDVLAGMMNEVDADGIGAITFPQFLGIIACRLRDRESEEEILAAFRIFDRHGTGVFTIAQLRQFMASLGERLSDEDMDEMIREGDINGDGQIHYLEYLKTSKMMT